MDVDSFPTFGSTTGTRVFDQLTESNPSPSRRNVEKVDFFAHQRQWLLLLDFALLFELLAFVFDGFEEFFCGAVFGVLLGEFATDCCMQDCAFQCSCERAIYRFSLSLSSSAS